MKLPKGFIAENKYGRYYIPSFCGPRCKVAAKIKSGRVWEPETISFMIDHIGDYDIVHAGTYFGDFLPALSKNLKDGSIIWAFEPNPITYMCSVKTIELNELDNIHIENMGLGTHPDSMFVKIRRKGGSSLGGGAKIVENDNGIPVSISRLDDIIPEDRKISIIQLDVEGYEKQGLMGGMNIITRDLPILILEVGKKRTLVDSSWFKDNIMSLGYKETKRIHENLVYSI